MDSRVRDMVMGLLLTKTARSILVAAVCGLMVLISAALSLADEYRWDKSAIPEDDPHLLYEPDPTICRLYEENLRYFANRNTPMSCYRPIAPHLKDRIKDVEWEDLDPDRYPDLLRAIATCNRYLPGTAEDIVQRDLKYIRANIANRVRGFRRAKLLLVGRIEVQAYSADPEPYWIVQYGVNDVSPDNPDEVWRCKPRRGGGKESDLKLYIVSEAKQKLTNKLWVSSGRPSHEGQHLKIIDGRLFVESIEPTGSIELSEVDTAVPAAVITCEFEFKKSR